MSERYGGKTCAQRSVRYNFWYAHIIIVIIIITIIIKTSKVFEQNMLYILASVKFIFDFLHFE
jgi:uncharacterized membrane protein YjdF